MGWWLSVDMNIKPNSHGHFGWCVKSGKQSLRTRSIAIKHHLSVQAQIEMKLINYCLARTSINTRIYIYISNCGGCIPNVM